MARARQIYSIILFILLSFAASGQCNFDESMCPDCGTLRSAKVSNGAYQFYRGGESLTCKYEEDYEFYYHCFNNSADARIAYEYDEPRVKPGPPPWCSTNYCNLLGKVVVKCAGDGNHIGMHGGYFLEGNMYGHVHLILRGQDYDCDDAADAIEHIKPCAMNLGEPPEFKGIDLRLHIEDHPLKHLKVMIDGKAYYTDENGIVKVPENGEATIQFIYYDEKEYFSIYVQGEKKPLEFNIKIKEGKIVEGTLDSGEEKAAFSMDKAVSNFDFNHIAAELYFTAKRYVHLTEALEFYQEHGVEFARPVKVVTFVNYPGRAQYNEYRIVIDNSLSADHEWNPFVVYHEFSHYAMNHMYGDEMFREMALNSPNHGGFANPTTADSWMEGFAAFMPVIIANENGRWWTEHPMEKRPAFYPMAGSLDANYKAWEKEGKAEEFAIAALLWDIVDGDFQAFDSSFGAEYLYLNFFRLWDQNKDGIITYEECYIGNLADKYAKNPELDPVTWYYMIELGKDLEDYYDFEPDMEIFDRYDDGDGILTEAELNEMSDIMNGKDGYLIDSEWLKYYDKDGDRKISREEGKSLLKGYEIVMKISDGKEVTETKDVKGWLKNQELVSYLDEHILLPPKDGMSKEEFTDWVMDKISTADDDRLNWDFDVLWDEVLSKKQKDFNSVLEALEAVEGPDFEDAVIEMIEPHGLYKRKAEGDKRYNQGEAYTDSNKNGRWDEGEDFIDYPASWDLGDDDIIGVPSNYQRMERTSSPMFGGHYIKADGAYDVVYLIKDDFKIIDVVGYTAKSDGMLYVPVPPDSVVAISKTNYDEEGDPLDEPNEPMVRLTSQAFEENYEQILEQGYITAVRTSRATPMILLVLVLIILGIATSMFIMLKNKPGKKKSKKRK